MEQFETDEGDQMPSNGTGVVGRAFGGAAAGLVVLAIGFVAAAKLFGILYNTIVGGPLRRFQPFAKALRLELDHGWCAFAYVLVGAVLTGAVAAAIAMFRDRSAIGDDAG